MAKVAMVVFLFLVACGSTEATHDAAPDAYDPRAVVECGPLSRCEAACVDPEPFRIECSYLWEGKPARCSDPVVVDLGDGQPSFGCCVGTWDEEAGETWDDSVTRFLPCIGF